MDDEDALLRACAALEMLHASALVHDDYMDASDTRRGRPSTHRAFATAHRSASWRGDPEQYGGSAAILLGDLLLSWLDELLRRCGFPADRVMAGFEVFDDCRTEVITGQFLDVSVQARGRADVDAAMTVLRYKSAKYSIERPLHIGATLAGARAGDQPDALLELSAYGLPLGEAFQLRDDLLGVYGDPAATGKPAGDDLVEGKRTVLVALALDGAPAADAARLDAALGTPLSDEQVAELRRVIDASGAHAHVERVIDDLAALAVDRLEAPRSPNRRARCCASWPPPPPTGWSERIAAQGRPAVSPATSGPSPRSTTTNGPPRSAFTRPPRPTATPRRHARRGARTVPSRPIGAASPRCRRRPRRPGSRPASRSSA